MSADRFGRRGIARLLGAAVLVFSASACSWFTDFKDQPHIYPWESASDSVPPRGNPQHSVPVQGSAAPGFAVSYAAMPGTIDSLAAVANPVPADARSLENGRKLYQINCLPCHGATGIGDGPVTKFGMPGIAIVTDITKGRSDGYIWGMMRNGRGLMPSYNRLEEMERWDVVNYVRGLQGRLGAAVPTTLAGRPGETGRTLPSASELGPTRPAPYYNHIGAQAGVQRRTAAAAPTTRPDSVPATAAPGAAGASARADSAAAPRTPDTTQTPRVRQ